MVDCSCRHLKIASGILVGLCCVFFATALTVGLVFLLYFKDHSENADMDVYEIQLQVSSDDGESLAISPPIPFLQDGNYTISTTDTDTLTFRPNPLRHPIPSMFCVVNIAYATVRFYDAPPTQVPKDGNYVCGQVDFDDSSQPGALSIRFSTPSLYQTVLIMTASSTNDNAVTQNVSILSKDNTQHIHKSPLATTNSTSPTPHIWSTTFTAVYNNKEKAVTYLPATGTSFTNTTIAYL